MSFGKHPVIPDILSDTACNLCEGVLATVCKWTGCQVRVDEFERTSQKMKKTKYEVSY